MSKKVIGGNETSATSEEVKEIKVTVCVDFIRKNQQCGDQGFYGSLYRNKQTEKKSEASFITLKERMHCGELCVDLNIDLESIGGNPDYSQLFADVVLNCEVLPSSRNNAYQHRFPGPPHRGVFAAENITGIKWFGVEYSFGPEYSYNLTEDSFDIAAFRVQVIKRINQFMVILKDITGELNFGKALEIPTKDITW